MKERIVGFAKFLKQEIVLVLATMAALISMTIVPPDAQYIKYIDFKVIVLLFCLMTVVAGLMRIRVFDRISGILLKKTRNRKLLAILFVNCTFIFAMFITNDVALITMVPLTIGLFGNESKPSQTKLIFLIVMETIAANLGSMLTPIGNPQNLYLFSYFSMDISEFLAAVLPMGIIGYIFMMTMMLFMPKGTIENVPESTVRIQSRSKLMVYLLLFLLCIITVLRVLDYRICFLLILLGIVITDRQILKNVDYSLLLTFVMFFIFVGNLGRIESIKSIFSAGIAGNECWLGILTSQVVSNVPAAIMLSGFTENVRQLILGVNIGGFGTLIASLASLISFRIYAKSKHAQIGRFFGIFTACNILMLSVMILCCRLFGFA